MGVKKIKRRNIVTILVIILVNNFVSCQVEPDNTTADVPVVDFHEKPRKENLADNNNPATRDHLGQWLINGCWGQSCGEAASSTRKIEYEGYDGFYNNLARPDLGAIDTPLLRRVPAAYADGVYQPSGYKRPNPIELSDKLMSGNIGTQSKLGRTALLVFFGQQVVEEILDAQRPACPPEYFNIKIREKHRYHNETGHTVMPLLRTRYDMRTGFSPNNPRQQLNEITPWLDGGLTYGTTKTWADQLRSYDNGTLYPSGLLAYSHDGLFPAYNTIRLPMANPPPPANHTQYIHRHYTAPVYRFFKLGNPRGNENPFLLTFGILWFRWHNYLAQQIKKTNPKWSNEKIFNEARKWVIASHQKIVVEDWLHEWLGTPLPEYTAYDPSIDPQIDQFFQSAAFRFGHTLVPPGVYLRDYGRDGCKTKLPGWNGVAVRTCNSFWKPQDSIMSRVNRTDFINIDRLLMGMAVQLCEREDHKIVEDLRQNVFGPLEFSRRDLMAVNIQRGRDHGLPDYNTARNAFNLPRMTDPSNFTNVDKTIQDELYKLYNNSMDDIDVWVGGLLETGDGPGELFRAIISDQFRRIRDGDRFWFQNKQNGLFTDDEIGRLRKLTLYDIIMAVTKMDYNDIQENPFKAPTALEVLHSNCRDTLISSPCGNTLCYHLPQLNNLTVEECTPAGTYDYFSNSENSYILTFVGISLFIVSLAGYVKIMTFFNKQRKLKEVEKLTGRLRESFRKDKVQRTLYSALELVDRKGNIRSVVIMLDYDKKQIQVHNQLGQMLRVMDLKQSCTMNLITTTDGQHILIRLTNDYDLVLKFDSEFLRNRFLQDFEEFITRVGVVNERLALPYKAAIKQAVTRYDRQKRLEMFFRVVFSQAFQIAHSETEIISMDSKTAREVIYTELTINEFADALSMRAESEFVQKMFLLVDKDKNGFISFREFVDMLVVFAIGTAADKAKLMFDMYDINRTGKITKEEFTDMIKSFMETANADVEQNDLEQVVNDMMTSAGLAKKVTMSLEDFQRLLAEHEDKLNYAELNFSGIPDTTQPSKSAGKSNRLRANSFLDNVQRTAFSLYATGNEIRQATKPSEQAEKSIDDEQELVIKHMEQTPPNPSIWLAIHRYIQNSAHEIFWMALYTLILWSIFAERAYYYSVEREHSGLRRIAGYGVTVTRGAASAMMFTYSSLLITMCRNIITILRDTFLHRYFPFDSSVYMHKYIALWALFFTVIHIIGHAFNFYSISTQTSNDLTCLFRNYHHATHEIPKFHYWCWQTITGITGVLLTLLTGMIYIFAFPFIRTDLYNAFWFAHSLYPVLYILMILHGAGRLIQEPFFYYFFLGPCILFTIDRMITATRKKVEIPVVRAELLPSNVTFLEFQKPSNFQFKSGQWVRIACPALSSSEYHPFTISSSPNEKNLTLHIRAVGPWTTNIRNLYDPSMLRENPLPKIHLDGPFGEGHQDWHQYDVAVLIGGGIGVTPFASILKDIVYRKNITHLTSCKKVYFLWVTKTQKQFEWLVDIIRDVENSDENKVVSVHIFITQFYQKFDLRTILLYICERHFQRVSGRSLFTGLQAVTHFGRPNFNQFFKSMQVVNPKARKVGVFSCGPGPLTNMVDRECVKLNTETHEGPIFQHHFKNF